MKLLTCVDVARRVGLTTDAIRKAERRGNLRAMRTESGRRLFRESEVQSQETLQEWIGYLLTPRTHFQKIAMIVGPRRHFENLGSPVGSFLRDRCTIDRERKVGQRQLFESWKVSAMAAPEC